MEKIKTEWRKYITILVAICLFTFQMLAMSFAIIPVMAHRMIFLALVLLLVYIRKPNNLYEKISNYISVPLLLAIIVYAVLNSQRIATRIVFVHQLLFVDKFFGICLIILLLEATRRIGGNVLFGLVLLFVVYGFLGKNIPGPLSHSGFSIKTFIESNFMSTGGIFGSPTGAVIEYVFYFLLFTAFLEVSGGGKLFIDASLKVAGRSRGGTAKAAVIAAGLMGMISGSAVANVVAVGSLTIPIMKDNNFEDEVSGGIMAAASTGGQLMPPIMGAAAFVMAETIGLSYGKIAIAAALPAFFYYLGIFLMVDMYAQKNGLKGLSKDKLPNIKESVKTYGLTLIPLVVLVYYIAIGKSIMTSCINSTVLLIVLSLFRKETRMLPKKILEALVLTIKGLPSITVPCAAAGIIISTVISSSLATKFSSVFVEISHGNIMINLIATMIVCIILGMGMPTISSYIIVSMLLVPTIVGLGIPVLAAHMFAFYFALLSFVTPPVALCAYTAAGIAGSDPSRTGWRAFKYTFAGFIVPYIFIFDQALLLEGNYLNIIWDFVTTALAIWVLAGAIQGWYFAKASILWRFIGLIGAILMITPSQIQDIIGTILSVIVLIISYRKNRINFTESKVTDS